MNERPFVIHGDAREALLDFAPGHFDSVVTDPPYALVSIVKRFGADGAAPAKEYAGGLGAYARSSRGFMGQKWDTGETAFDPAFWREVYRVLKPGGHVLAFGGTRTYHRLACAIDDAGFEIRDMVAWLYGSGFPKSHDVSKGIAKRRVEDIDPVRMVCRFIRAAMDIKGLKSRDLTRHFDNCHPRLIDHWAARDTDSQPTLPTSDQWEILKQVLALDDSMDLEVDRLNARKGECGAAWSDAEIIGEYDGVPGGFGDHRFSFRDKGIRAVDDEWQGWGTALKPALEPIVLARKPLIATVAENVLKHGTGAINVDGCRVEAEQWSSSGELAGGATIRAYGNGLNNSGRSSSHSLCRWPANVIHDGSDEAVEGFPREAGAFAPVKGTEPSSTCSGDIYQLRDRVATVHHGDSGSAARFFYTAKADETDRIGSKHPTVKPVDLMQYLCRLITPPGGVVLDPFAGSGSTGEAAWREGFRAVLIEREADYIADIHRRLELLLTGPEERQRAIIDAKGKLEPVDTLPLFSKREGVM